MINPNLIVIHSHLQVIMENMLFIRTISIIAVCVFLFSCTSDVDKGLESKPQLPVSSETLSNTMFEFGDHMDNLVQLNLQYFAASRRFLNLDDISGTALDAMKSAGELVDTIKIYELSSETEVIEYVVGIMKVIARYDTRTDLGLLRKLQSNIEAVSHSEPTMPANVLAELRSLESTMERYHDLLTDLQNALN